MRLTPEKRWVGVRRGNEFREWSRERGIGWVRLGSWVDGLMKTEELCAFGWIPLMRTKVEIIFQESKSLCEGFWRSFGSSGSGWTSWRAHKDAPIIVGIHMNMHIFWALVSWKIRSIERIV